MHAAGYLPAACRVEDEFCGIDLGTGAGVPGVVLAALRPSSEWLLVDANERRCEFAQQAARALGVTDRVHARAEELAHDPAVRGSRDLVVARLFGAPAELAECALPLVAGGGRLVVSVVDDTLVWWQEAAPALGIYVEAYHRASGGQYVEASITRAVPASWPRRPAARRRSPLY
jgi:16S rRNA G527 N7-methylase RsmG